MYIACMYTHENTLLTKRVHRLLIPSCFSMFLSFVLHYSKDSRDPSLYRMYIVQVGQYLYPFVYGEGQLMFVMSILSHRLLHFFINDDLGLGDKRQLVP